MFCFLLFAGEAIEGVWRRLSVGADVPVCAGKRGLRNEGHTIKAFLI